MKDETWRRHANPWSVWTRFAAIPPLILAIWSRAWIGWWCLVPLAVVIAWLIINPSAFAPVDEPKRWTERGIYGERIWVRDKDIPGEHKRILMLLLVLAGIGAALLALGLVTLNVWPTVFGATLVVITQLWRIDRFATLYDAKSVSPQ
ncbi:polyferredoxin [Kibdelosporangium banguiense]|uniref:Polyferredoxin n=1 Tax=Kibdelosporangium banguiense TaxID=1365924 RepID=A0ABS4T931_9PSEU|nr:DUF6653 family protein [Kibdelosporangium banguiense]MBP2320944.1 polyferredoxin [Kibdelosporangium banguiense]